MSPGGKVPPDRSQRMVSLCLLDLRRETPVALLLVSDSVGWILLSEEGRSDLIWQLAYPLNFRKPCAARHVYLSLSAHSNGTALPCCWCWLHLRRQWRLQKMLRLCPWTRRRLITPRPLNMAGSVGADSLSAFLHVVNEQVVVILGGYGCRSHRRAEAVVLVADAGLRVL